MKKKFVIKPPQEGRSTVELRAYSYLSKATALADGKERGTKDNYLGSFSQNLDPELLAEVTAVPPGSQLGGIKLRPGRMVDGEPFELHEQDVREIRHWLLQHGNHVRREQERMRLQAERDAAAAALRLQIEREVQLELRESTRAELLEELRPSSAIPAIYAAIEALAWAARAVEIEARTLGEPLATRRTKAMASAPSEAGQLLEATQRLRRDAFAAFESCCKKAGLMAQKRADRADRTPA